MNSVRTTTARESRTGPRGRPAAPRGGSGDRAGRPPPAWFQPAARIPSTMRAEQLGVAGPVTPRMPGPVWVPIDRADLRDQLRVAAVDLAAALGHALGLGARLDVLDGERVAAVLAALLEVGDEPLERAARGAHALDGLHLALDREDRLDLQRRADPGRAAPIRPPRRRYSSVSTMTMICRFSRIALRGGRPPPRGRRRRSSGVGRRDGHEAVPGAARQRVDHDHPLGRHPALDQQLARLLGRAHRAGDAAARGGSRRCRRRCSTSGS